MAIKAKGFSLSSLLLLLAAIAIWSWTEWQSAKSDNSIIRAQESSPASDETEPRQSGEYPVPITPGGYEAHRNCTWVEHPRNDGDSFRLKLPDGRIEQFRLYFVDAPESEFRTYGEGRNNHERIHDQALDFGVSDKEVVEIGKKAKKRVESLLKDQSLTIFTKWEDPYGDKRYRAYIRLTNGRLLHERLVMDGLVRVHTKGADLPDGMPEASHQRHLEGMEKQARANKSSDN